MKLFKNWKDKKVLITGGTSGLGQALALQLNELGAKVAIIARTKAKIEALVRESPQLIGIEGDVSKKESIYPLAGEVYTRLGDIDVLFNIASYLGQTPLRTLIDTECEDFEQVLQANLLGPFRLTKALIPPMLLRGEGLVVNISSDAAVNAYPNWGSYSVSKAGVDHLSRIFDAELKDRGVRFLSLDPGDMRTPMHFAAIPDADPENLRDPADSAQLIHEFILKGDFSKIRRKV